jgi:hypothetical protein
MARDLVLQFAVLDTSYTYQICKGEILGMCPNPALGVPTPGEIPHLAML